MWHPSGDWLAFRSDRGDEMQVYGIAPRGGEAWPVTSGAHSVQGFRFSPDGSRLAMVANAQLTDADEALEKLRGRPIVWDSSYTDEWSHLWVAELENRRAGEPTRWSPDTLHVTTAVWAPDSRRLAYGATFSHPADVSPRQRVRAEGTGGTPDLRHLHAGRRDPGRLVGRVGRRLFGYRPVPRHLQLATVEGRPGGRGTRVAHGTLRRERVVRGAAR